MATDVIPSNVCSDAERCRRRSCKKRICFIAIRGRPSDVRRTFAGRPTVGRLTDVCRTSVARPSDGASDVRPTGHPTDVPRTSRRTSVGRPKKKKNNNNNLLYPTDGTNAFQSSYGMKGHLGVPTKTLMLFQDIRMLDSLHTQPQRCYSIRIRKAKYFSF